MTPLSRPTQPVSYSHKRRNNAPGVIRGPDSRDRVSLLRAREPLVLVIASTAPVPVLISARFHLTAKTRGGKPYDVCGAKLAPKPRTEPTTRTGSGGQATRSPVGSAAL